MVLSAASLIAAIALASAILNADVIMTPAGLNTALKKMEKLKQQIASSPRAGREEALFQLGVEGDALAALMNQEVASHGMEQRELLDLALSRTKELGVAIAYNRSKKKFFYDGAAFREYVDSAPAGAHAADARFALVSYEFYQSEPGDTASLVASAERKRQFLARYPKYRGGPEVSLFLAIDYRDLYRRSVDAHDAAGAEKYRQLTRATYQRISQRYAGTDQATEAKDLLRRFDEESKR